MPDATAPPWMQMLEEVTGRALDASMAVAKTQGCGLRSIGHAVGLSHETVRGRLAEVEGADGRRQ